MSNDKSHRDGAPIRGGTSDRFHSFAVQSARAAGAPRTFTLAIAAIVAWAATGPFFGYSDTWQLVINTGTTVVTFLIVFLIQNTQNRDAAVIHLKLDELLRAVKGARTRLINLEEMSEAEIRSLEEQFRRIRHKGAS